MIFTIIVIKHGGGGAQGVQCTLAQVFGLEHGVMYKYHVVIRRRDWTRNP